MARECRDAHGSREECVRAGRAALAACRETADCAPAEDHRLVAEALLTLERLFIRGDVSGDNRISLLDPVTILNILYLGSTAPSCLDAADANDDGAIDMSDAVILLKHLFFGQGRLPAPSDAPGVDPTPDKLRCEEADSRQTATKR